MVCGSEVYLWLAWRPYLISYPHSCRSSVDGLWQHDLLQAYIEESDQTYPHSWISLRWTVCASKVSLRLTEKTLIRCIRTVRSVFDGRSVIAKFSSGWQRRLWSDRIGTTGSVFDGRSVTAKSISGWQRRLWSDFVSAQLDQSSMGDLWQQSLSQADSEDSDLTLYQHNWISLRWASVIAKSISGWQRRLWSDFVSAQLDQSSMGGL